MAPAARPFKIPGSTQKRGGKSVAPTPAKVFGAGDPGDMGGMKTPVHRRKALGDLNSGRRGLHNLTNKKQGKGLSRVGENQASTTKRSVVHKNRRPKRHPPLEIELGPPPRPPSPEFTIDEVERELSQCFATLLPSGRCGTAGSKVVATPPSIRRKQRDMTLPDDDGPGLINHGSPGGVDECFMLLADDEPIEELSFDMSDELGVDAT
eukprot:CAMPEP_0206305128 /NCGR_PEP_ID=MMETSP0106_2-20121207/10102_1 /ASSEMBLY_ACC=CAM_ASM_000206 /TAXON_ID=81532 /ORGANISM="Acanthoeca-like sp., Strain 10tr" /LENGTH=207 /DNA_ID=CAMNT_0053735963 /DNA_START=86 /DNA_END=709 /DNA_ORIENTATION=+